MLGTEARLTEIEDVRPRNYLLAPIPKMLYIEGNVERTNEVNGKKLFNLEI